MRQGEGEGGLGGDEEGERRREAWGRGRGGGGLGGDEEGGRPGWGRGRGEGEGGLGQGRAALGHTGLV